jgi:hypothetical protein
MDALRRVHATIGQSKTLDWTAAYDVRFDDLAHVGNRHAAVPHAVGIDDDRWTVFTLVEAAGLIGAHGCLNARLCQSRFEGPLQISPSGWIAASPGMAVDTLIAAHKDVFRKIRHETNLALALNKVVCLATKTGRLQRPEEGTPCLKR